MKALCGAWALGGGPIQSLLGERERGAIVAAAGGRPGAVEEILSGPLWLAAPPANIARRPGAVMGMEGFIAPGAGSVSALAGLLERFELDDEPRADAGGHYVLAYAELGRKRLSLLRDLSGFEQLYFTCVDGLLLFSSSVTALLAHPAVPRAADSDTIVEQALFGMPVFGDATAFAGIREVLPGHRLDVTTAGISQRWLGGLTFEPIAGELPELGGRLWSGLLVAVRDALGTEREAAVSLSGGIDSAAVAAALVEVLGPDRVHAFTYELEGSPFPSEIPMARLTCRRLGITSHAVKTITAAEHLAAAPEAIRQLERAANWKMSAIELLMSRWIASHGRSSYFSGFGIPGQLGYLQELAEAWSTAPGLMRRYWRRAVDDRGGRWRALSRLHPGLDMETFRNPALFLPVLCVLRHNGLLDDLSGFYREPLNSMAEELYDRPRVVQALAQTRGWTLAAQLQFHAFVHLNSYDDRGRKDKISRLAGAIKISPFLFPSCLALANLPLESRPAFWKARRSLKPGKLILQEAVRNRLPSEVVFRAKLYGQNVPPRGWDEAFVRSWEPELSASIQTLASLFGTRWGRLRPHFDSLLIPLALWHSLLIGRSSATEPKC